MEKNDFEVFHYKIYKSAQQPTIVFDFFLNFQKGKYISFKNQLLSVLFTVVGVVCELPSLTHA